MQDLIHRMNQTAHISLQIPAISKSVETKSTSGALAYRRDLPHLPQVFLTSRPSEAPLPQAVRPPSTASAPLVKAYLRPTHKPCNPFFRETSSFFHTGHFSLKIIALRNRNAILTVCTAIILRAGSAPCPNMLRYPQAYPQAATDPGAKRRGNTPTRPGTTPIAAPFTESICSDAPNSSAFCPRILRITANARFSVCLLERHPCPETAFLMCNSQTRSRATGGSIQKVRYI
jgi:hypothetical protein